MPEAARSLKAAEESEEEAAEKAGLVSGRWRPGVMNGSSLESRDPKVAAARALATNDSLEACDGSTTALSVPGAAKIDRPI